MNGLVDPAMRQIRDIFLESDRVVAYNVLCDAPLPVQDRCLMVLERRLQWTKKMFCLICKEEVRVTAKVVKPGLPCVSRKSPSVIDVDS